MHSAKDAWEGRLQALQQELQECKQAWKKDVAEKEAAASATHARLVAKVQAEHAEVIQSLRSQYNASVAELKKVRDATPGCEPPTGTVLTPRVAVCWHCRTSRKRHSGRRRSTWSGRQETTRSTSGAWRSWPASAALSWRKPSKKRKLPSRYGSWVA